MKKRIFSILLYALIFTFSFSMLLLAGCDNANKKVVVDSFTLNYELKEIGIGENFLIEISESKYVGQVRFTSEDENIAIVSPNGVVTGVSQGSTKINVTLGNYSTHCTVIVLNSSTVSGESFNVVLNKSVLTLKNGSSDSLFANVFIGASLFEGDVDWSVSDASKLKIDVDATNKNKVKITALDLGEVELIATYGNFVAKCTVTIEADVDFVFDKDEGREFTKISKNENKNIKPTIYVGEQIDDSAVLSFESSNENVVSVDEFGNIVGVGFGNAIVYITYGEQVFEYKVEVFDRIIYTSIEKLIYDVSGRNEYSFEITQEELSGIDYPLNLSDINKLYLADSETTYNVSVSGSTLVAKGLPGGENEFYLYNGNTKFAVELCVATKVISNYDDLVNFRNQLSTNVTASGIKHVMANEYVVLVNDIDCGGNVFETSVYGNSFAGVFDGRGYQIKNVKFNSSGLFSIVSGTIKNLGLSFEANTESAFGAIATDLRPNSNEAVPSMITDVFVEGTIKTTSVKNIGGIASKIYSGTKIQNAFVNVMFDFNQYSRPVLGAIVAVMEGSTINCYGVSNVQGLSATQGTNTNLVKLSFEEFISAKIALDNYGEEWDTSCGVPLLVNYTENIPDIEILNTQTEVAEKFTIITNDSKVKFSIEDNVQGVEINAQGVVTFSSRNKFTFKVKATSIYDESKFTTKEFSYAGGLVVDMTDQTSIYTINVNNKADVQFNISEFAEYEFTFRVTSLTIGSVDVTAYSYMFGKLTMSASAIETLSLGEQVAVITTNVGVTYRFNVTVLNSITITTKDQFISVFNGLYALGASNVDSPVEIVLGADIEFSSSDAPLQRQGSFTFYGSIDGQGYAVKNLKIDTKAKAVAGGLLGDCYGDVKNIAFVNIMVDNGTCGNAFGVICSTLKAGATISNVFISGTTKVGGNNAGGIVWTNEGTVKNCIVALETNNTAAYSSAAVKVGASTNCYGISSTYKFLSVHQGTTCKANAEEFFNSVNSLPTSDGWSNLWKIENGTLSFGNNAVLSR